MKAWFNYGREAQAYRARPDKLRPFVERNVNLLREGVAPTAYFIDVWSSAPPYDYWTGDGTFVERAATQRAWGEAFALIRDRLGNSAPQISEAGHDKLIGWLDGAQAQQLRVDPRGASFTWKIECADAERIPWIDVAWHDKFILHGAGYEGRYGAASGSDDYLSTEVLSGRPAMVAQPFDRNVVRVYWLLNAATARAGRRSHRRRGVRRRQHPPAARALGEGRGGLGQSRRRAVERRRTRPAAVRFLCPRRRRGSRRRNARRQARRVVPLAGRKVRGWTIYPNRGQRTPSARVRGIIYP
jgi:hypothetical protein